MGNDVRIMINVQVETLRLSVGGFKINVLNLKSQGILRWLSYMYEMQ